jgi:hypothetical protein
MYCMHLNTFVWEAVRRFHQTPNGPMAQQKLRTADLAPCTSWDNYGHLQATPDAAASAHFAFRLRGLATILPLDRISAEDQTAWPLYILWHWTKHEVSRWKPSKPDDLNSNCSSGKVLIFVTLNFGVWTLKYSVFPWRGSMHGVRKISYSLAFQSIGPAQHDSCS